MARKLKSIAALWQELSNEEYITAYSGEDGRPLRWHWIDYPLLTFSDVLKITRLPKGRIESYSRRKIWDLEMFGSEAKGSGRHVLYSPRGVLNLIAIDRLAEAGAWPECLIDQFRKGGNFNGILNGYQFRHFKDGGKRDIERILILNDGLSRYVRIHGKFPPPEPGRPFYEVGPVPEDWIELSFDVDPFLRDTMPRIIGYLREQGVLAPN